MSEESSVRNIKLSWMKKHLSWLLPLSLLLFGLGLRLVDLTDPPLDFHPTRQLRAAIIARGMYYEMLSDADPVVADKALQLRAALETYEPQIFERLTALSYLAIGGETLWTARLFAILFWCVGGVFLFDLARRMVSWGGGLVALAYYLFLPLSVQASRSFQPDPLVTLWILVSLWTTYRWSQVRTWPWGVATGLIAGLTLLIKPTAVFGYVGAAEGVPPVGSVGCFSPGGVDSRQFLHRPEGTKFDELYRFLDRLILQSVDRTCVLCTVVEDFGSIVQPGSFRGRIGEYSLISGTWPTKCTVGHVVRLWYVWAVFSIPNTHP